MIDQYSLCHLEIERHASHRERSTGVGVSKLGILLTIHTQQNPSKEGLTHMLIHNSSFLDLYPVVVNFSCFPKGGGCLV